MHRNAAHYHEKRPKLMLNGRWTEKLGVIAVDAFYKFPPRQRGNVNNSTFALKNLFKPFGISMFLKP